MQHEENSSSVVEKLSLKALKLRAGMALQTRRLVEGASKKEAQFFGAIEGKGVMVGPTGPDGAQTGLSEGEVCVVRGFTGQHEFSFLSKVLQTFEKPFAYALLAYPAQVDARLVRQSMRTKTSWPTTAHRNGGASAPGDPQPLDVTLVDLSTAGAMIKAASGLAAIGETVTLRMAVTVDQAPVQLTLAGRVCHNNQGSNDPSFYIGLAFKDLSQNDKLVLHYVTQAA
ncbi:MAG: PilZ domain-containing protein [Rhodoferax sp.]